MRRSISKMVRAFAVLFVLSLCFSMTYASTTQQSVRTKGVKDGLNIPSYDEWSRTGEWTYLITTSSAPLRPEYYQSSPSDIVIPANDYVRVHYYDINKYGNKWYFCRYDDTTTGTTYMGWVYSGNFN